ncbi:transposase [Cryobacterium glaciale]|uniref:Transposase n=1 Tax=Cryobacterium glaciale TaxID=1259145 RepID=A0A4R8UZC9_9MICO|nr:IS3 family transposase [Cryobacterium glaciale]TFB73376.1 transposase [Cryobacterium glaciale]
MIAQLKADFPVTYLCQKLEVSTSAFYDWAISHTTATNQRREELTALVITTFAASNNVSGYRKVTAAIQKDGVGVNRKRSPESWPTSA